MVFDRLGVYLRGVHRARNAGRSIGNLPASYLYNDTSPDSYTDSNTRTDS